MTFRTTIWTVGVGVLWVPPLSGQSPEQRVELERFRSELQVATDSTPLLTFEAALIAAARANRDDAFLHLKLGFLAYRLGQITEGQQHYENAASEFEWAVDLEPSWPYPWYGLGLAELAIGEHDLLFIETLREIFGKDALSKAATAFARAAERDPSFVSAVVDLAMTALEHAQESRLNVALAAVREAAATSAGADPALLLARGRVERRVGEGDSSLVALRRLLDVTPDSGLAMLETARTLFYVNRPSEASDAYFRAIELARSEEAISLFRSDLSWIASDEERAAFDALPATERRPWLERFWERRDLIDVRRPGERLAEHYRRFFYALRHYPLGSRHRRYDITNPFRTDQRSFDDRGLIYLRHGEPDRRAVYAAVTVEPNESWLYRRSDGDLLFHFTARDEYSDFKLVESVLHVFGLETALTVQTRGLNAAPEAVALLESRQFLHPVYGRMLAGGTTQQINAMTDERDLGGRALEVGTTTDTYRLRFESSLDGVVRPLVVSDPRAEPRLVLAFAVPGRSLRASPVGDVMAYPLELRVAVSQSNRGHLTAYLDTTRVFATPQALARHEYLTGVLEVPLEPGSYGVRVLLAQPASDAGQVVVFEEIAVPAFGSGDFTVSDLLIGRAGERRAWIADADSVSVNPLATYPEGSVLTLYYQVHGLERGTTYRARVEIKKEGGGLLRKIFGGGKPPVALSLTQVADGPATRVAQTVDLTSLKPGRYQLTLTIEDPASDAHHTKQTWIDVIGT